MTTILDLQKRSHQTAIDKGWWDEHLVDGVVVVKPGKRQYLIEEKVALVHSEISEALEDYRARQMVTTYEESGKPVGFPTEIADVAIRWMDLFGALGITPHGTTSHTFEETMKGAHLTRQHDGWFELPYEEKAKVGDDTVVAQAICRMHSSAASTGALLRHGYGMNQDAACYRVLMDVAAVAYHLQVELTKEIEIKQAFNDTRSYKHGGKRV